MTTKPTIIDDTTPKGHRILAIRSSLGESPWSSTDAAAKREAAGRALKSTAEPHVTVGGQPSTPPLERVQYLSRQSSKTLTMPIARLSSEGPVAAITEAVGRQWAKYAERQPLDVDPTFLAAPQTEYYGSTILPSGEILHRSAAMNALRVFKDRETGGLVFLSCHEFTFHVAAPRDPLQVWRLELCYPTEERLQPVMKVLNPAEEDGGFPIHATSSPPPMLPLQERVSLGTERATPTETADDVLREEVTTVAPADTQGEAANTFAVYFQDLTPRINQRAEALNWEMQRRAQRNLRLDGDSLYDSDTDSMPELVSSSTSSDSESTLEPERCEICHEPQHLLFETCPYEGSSDRGYSSIRIVNTAESEEDREELAITQMMEMLQRFFGQELDKHWTEWIADVAAGSHWDTDKCEIKEAGRIFQKTPPRKESVAESLARQRKSLARLEEEVAEVLAALSSSGSSEGTTTSNGSNKSKESAQTNTDYASTASTDSDEEEDLRATYRLIAVDPSSWSSAATDRMNAAGMGKPPSAQGEDIPVSDSSSGASEFPERDTGYTDPPPCSPTDSEEHDALPSLYFWAHEGTEEQKHVQQFEDDMGTDPANLTLRMIYGPLRQYINFVAMAAEGVEDLHQYSPPPSAVSATFPDMEYPVSDDEPIADQSPTSLDGSLPSSASLADIGEDRGNAAGRKRKAEGGDLNQGRKRPCRADPDARGRTIARRGSTELTAKEVVCLFAGVRLGILETARRMEDTVWSQYEINQACFPTNFVRHPLLYQYESARMQTVWYVLHRHGRHKLANKLWELLSIRLRTDRIEVALVNVAYLDRNYPESQYDCFDMLRQSGDPSPLRRRRYEVSSNDGSSEASDEELRLRYLDDESEMGAAVSSSDEPFICPTHAHLAPSTKYGYCFDKRGRILLGPVSVCYDEYGQPRPTAAELAGHVAYAI
ncbi:hypothetical protein C8R45DRAFT_1089735 [Mycena sanguinolenta]|nr:hypothetical protein C8R45DRAFT_1089735 [Mycena sanguinolenta]